MITAQQARDIAFQTHIDHVEYLAALEWLEQHVEPKIRKCAEAKNRYLFIDVNDEDIRPVTVEYALNRHGFTVTSAGGTLCEDGIHRVHCLRISWE